MAANRTIPTTGAGSAVFPDIKDEIEALWKYACVPLTGYGGTANAITANAEVALGAYANGNKFTLKPPADVTDALTLNINGLGIKDVVDRHGRPIIKGLMIADGEYPLEYDSVRGDFVAITLERGLVGRQSRYFSCASGDVYARSSNGPGSTTIETSTNKVNLKGLGFDSSSAEYAQISFRADKRWNEGTCTAVFVWTHGSTTVNFGVAWNIHGVAFSDDQDSDVAFGTAVTVTDTGGTTNKIYITAESSPFTLSNTPAAGDFVVLQIYRDPAHASDALAIDALLLGVHLFWTADTSEEVA
jgi:hypothetical protein